MEEQTPIWRVDVNILNKESWTANKGWSSSLGDGQLLVTPHRKNVSCYKMFTKKASQTWTDTLVQPKQ